MKIKCIWNEEEAHIKLPQYLKHICVSPNEFLDMLAYEIVKRKNRNFLFRLINSENASNNSTFVLSQYTLP